MKHKKVNYFHTQTLESKYWLVEGVENCNFIAFTYLKVFVYYLKTTCGEIMLEELFREIINLLFFVKSKFFFVSFV